MKAVGRTGAIALFYFEIVSIIALIIGLVVVNVLQPGSGMNIHPETLDNKAVAIYLHQAEQQGIIYFLLDIIPSNIIGAFASGNILQVLLFSILFGFALHCLGDKGMLIFNFITSFSKVIFSMMNMIMYLAPIGAFGGMAFTIGKYGIRFTGTARSADYLLLYHLYNLCRSNSGTNWAYSWFQHFKIYSIY